MRKGFQQFFSAFSHLRHERFVQQTTGLVFLFIALSLGFLFWKLWPDMASQPSVPLHYNIHFGTDRVGAWYNLFVCPAWMLVMYIVNAVTSLVVWKKDHTLSFFLFGTSAIVSAILFIALIFIVLLNMTYYG
ncbi:MAG: hypothetical protein WCT24_01665 [Patescibacteria group bacterium]